MTTAPQHLRCFIFLSHTVVFHSGPSSTCLYAAITKKKDCFPLLLSTFQLTGPFVNEFSLCIFNVSPLSPVLAHFGSLFLPLVTLFSPLPNKYPQNLFFISNAIAPLLDGCLGAPGPQVGPGANITLLTQRQAWPQACLRFIFPYQINYVKLMMMSQT